MRLNLLGSAAVFEAEGAQGAGGEQQQQQKPPEGGNKDQQQQDNKGGSFLSNPEGGADPKPPADWPEDWQTRMAGADKDVAKALARYQSPADVAKALREAQATIGRGLKAPPKPEESNAEALKAWRESQGIPAEPTGYKIADPVAKRFTDADKPNMELFTSGMHKRDMPPAAVNAALDIYADMQDQMIGAMQARDKSEKETCEDVLRTEWGQQWRNNAALAVRYAEQATPGVNWFDARLPDGRMLGSIPEIVKLFSKLGKDHFGDVLFAGEAAINQSESRMAEIKKLQADPASEYYRDGGKLRTEMMALIEAADRRQAATVNSPKPT